MKNYILVGGLIAIVIFLAGCSKSTNTTSTNTNTPMQTNNITIDNFAFNPNNIEINQGSTVTIKNNDSAPHRPISDDGSFDFGQLDPGQSSSQTLNQAGTFPYHCSIHPSMKATIIVK